MSSFLLREKFAPMRFLSRETVGNFFDLLAPCLGSTKMAWHGLFGVYGGISVSRLGFAGSFVRGIFMLELCIFFCVVITFFPPLRGELVLLFSLLFLLMWFWVYCFPFLPLIFIFFRCVTCFR